MRNSKAISPTPSPSLKIPLRAKLRVSWRAVRRVLMRPAYLTLAVLSGFAMIGVILWALNLNLLFYIWTESPLSFVEKISFVFQVYPNLFNQYATTLSTSYLVFGTLFGINISLLSFVLRARGRRAVKTGKSAGGVFAAILSSGCAACGTSILTPVLTLLFGGASIALANDIGLVINLLGSGLILYSIYTLGPTIATILASGE